MQPDIQAAKAALRKQIRGALQIISPAARKAMSAQIRDRLKEIPADRFIEIEGRGMREPSQLATADFLRDRHKGEHILVAAAPDSRSS